MYTGKLGPCMVRTYCGLQPVQSQARCIEGSNMYERALTYGCGITSQRDTFNCTCPEALYGQAGWTCSCRVVEALDKAVLAAEAVSCDGALFVQVRAFSAPRHH